LVVKIRVFVTGDVHGSGLVEQLAVEREGDALVFPRDKDSVMPSVVHGDQKHHRGSSDKENRHVKESPRNLICAEEVAHEHHRKERPSGGADKLRKEGMEHAPRGNAAHFAQEIIVVAEDIHDAIAPLFDIKTYIWTLGNININYKPASGVRKTMTRCGMMKRIWLCAI